MQRVNICKVSMKGKSFALNPLVEEQIAFPTKGNVTDLWHKRLGHYHYQGLLQMKPKEMVNGLLELEFHVSQCKAYQIGKLTRKPFPKATWRAIKKLQPIIQTLLAPR